MTSNIQLQRICQFCGKEFTAKTTTTQYCCLKCANRAYKKRTRESKIEKSNNETREIKNAPFQTIQQISAKDFLTINETCLLLTVSRTTLWRLIKKENLPVGTIGRLKRIRRSDIDSLFKAQNIDSTDQTTPALIFLEPKSTELSECYSLAEVKKQYRISDKTLYDLIRRYNIERIQVGKFVYVPKTEIEKYLGKPSLLF